MGLETMFRLGYALMFGTVVLMVYLSLTSAVTTTRDGETGTHPPCSFNPLCTCSKAFPDPGIVTCRNVPLPKIPNALNQSKVFKLFMQNTGLRYLEPFFLQHTGLYRLEVSWNPISDITAEAFSGLERSLWELDLNHNKLTSVPSRSLRYLQRLRLLDLTGNEITDLQPENWRGLETSLKTLILRDNGIFSLPPQVFGPLQELEHLDLSGNSIIDFDAHVFRDGPPKLIKLVLADNVFLNVPYQQLNYLKQLRHLDLSLNRISQLHNTEHNEGRRSGGGGSMTLDTLRLEYNQIQHLPPGAFQNFGHINKTFLDGNPIAVIQGGAFHQTHIKELSLRDCGVSELAHDAFNGLESSLQFLDLTGNNLTILPHQLFREFDFLRVLYLRDNFMSGNQPGEGLNGFQYQYSLYRLDITGIQNNVIGLRDLTRLKNLRSLVLSKLPQPHVAPDDFQEFGVDLEELKISESNLKTLKNHAFQHVRGVKRLDLSENSISSVEKDAFQEVGHSLVTLNMADGFAASMTKLPNDAFRHLTSLQELDFSNNKIRKVPETFFHFMKKLRVVQFQDNNIELIQKGTFQGDMHTTLEELSFAFNHITTIGQHSFVDLGNLQRLSFGDNVINKIDKRAFMNLHNLKFLNLRGNKISVISFESFQNLPALEELDLAYNSLNTFDFSWLDQVGTLSTFRLNVSHNEIRYLDSNTSSFVGGAGHGGIIFANVKVLDFSHNNITHFGRGYMRSVETSLTQLYLSHNSLRNATQEVFGNMFHLQWLDLSHNILQEMDFDCFRNSRKLQVLYLSHNRLNDIPSELFRSLTNLRVVDLSYNRLRTLPDVLFTDDSLEKLDMSHNLLSRIPLSSFGQIAPDNLVDFDLSHNLISALQTPDSFGRFKSLQWLDLSYNRLMRLDDGAFNALPRLSVLDLSHNQDLILDIKGKTFYGLEDTLQELFLRNLSLHAIPEMQLPTLRRLDLTDNDISNIPPETGRNLSSLRRLDANGNNLAVVPPAIQLMTQLKHLAVARNPIQALNFQSGLRLRELDIRHLPLNHFEVGALAKIPSLQTLHVSIFRDIRDFNLPHLLQDNHGLEHLHIEFFDRDRSTLGHEMNGPFPTKLRNLTLSGKALKTVNNNILQGIRNPHLHLRVYNASLDKIPRQIFEQSRYVRNLTVDVRDGHMKSLGNPNTAREPNQPRKIFLYDLQMNNNRWSCDCDLGWVEGWERKRRQFLCEENPDICYKVEEDRRTTTCDNKNRRSLLEILKSDLECGWSGAERHVTANFILVTTLSIIVGLTRS